MRDLPRPQGLYDPSYEHDACGIGIVAMKEQSHGGPGIFYMLFCVKGSHAYLGTCL